MAKITNLTGEEKLVGGGVGMVADGATVTVPQHVACDMNGLPGWKVEIDKPAGANAAEEVKNQKGGN